MWKQQRATEVFYTIVLVLQLFVCFISLACPFQSKPIECEIDNNQVIHRHQRTCSKLSFDWFICELFCHFVFESMDSISRMTFNSVMYILFFGQRNQIGVNPWKLVAIPGIRCVFVAVSFRLCFVYSFIYRTS